MVGSNADSDGNTNGYSENVSDNKSDVAGNSESITGLVDNISKTSKLSKSK